MLFSGGFGTLTAFFSSSHSVILAWRDWGEMGEGDAAHLSLERARDSFTFEFGFRDRNPYKVRVCEK